MRLELLSRAEKLGPTGSARIHTLGFRIPVFTGESTFGAAFTQYHVLFGLENFTPILRNFTDTR